MKIIEGISHLDHGLNHAHIEFINWKFGKLGTDGSTLKFFLETVEMPEGLDDLPCEMYGPIMGDLPGDQKQVSNKYFNSIT